MNHLTKVDKINENIYLSGIYPLMYDNQFIKDENISYIICCVPKIAVYQVHHKLLFNHPNLIILYLPYEDRLTQNLWVKNPKALEICNYYQTVDQFYKQTEWLNKYKNESFIDIGYHFLNDIQKCNGRVLVHCMAGISRSVSMVAYYLMKKHRFSYQTAILQIKNKRHIACPNLSFEHQLVNYERKIQSPMKTMC